MIKNGVASALEADYGRCFPNIPDKFTVETTYREHYRALNASYFPGAIKSGEYSVEYSAHDYLDVLRFFLFTL
ncbi:hypothetical protein SDC9_177507 [bioreactor metagenome]|uniref:Uncharacterized protein n=1 Tax=bioreactor metagenome TaxID=1076179 RepID=A0A645GUN5_9ZZZZ